MSRFINATAANTSIEMAAPAWRNIARCARARAAAAHAAKADALVKPGHPQVRDLIAAADRASEGALALHRMWWKASQA